MKTTSRRKFTARDLMTKPVETVRISDPLQAVAHLFTERSISAAAVLDKTGKAVGVITKTDLVRQAEQRDGLQVLSRRSGRRGDEDNPPTLIDEETVERWMTPVILAVRGETPATRVARRMVRYGTHHMFVKGEKSDDIVGIVSSFDLLRVYAAEDEQIG
jgi:CBS-domain-containing membrane protein